MLTDLQLGLAFGIAMVESRIEPQTLKPMHYRLMPIVHSVALPAKPDPIPRTRNSVRTLNGRVGKPALIPADAEYVTSFRCGSGPVTARK